MEKWLRARTALAEDQIWFLASQYGSQPFVTPYSGDLIPFLT